MPRMVRLLGISFLSLFSVEIVVAITDWFARWGWFKQVMADHPKFAAFVHTPFSYLVLLFFGFACLFAETRLKQPRIVARFINSRTIPDLSATPIQAVFDSEAKTPGWDEHKLDWDWFIEVQLANDSETPTTIDDVEVSIRIKREWGKKEVVKTEHSEGFDNFLIDKGLDVNLKAHAFSGEQYTKVPSLMETIRNVPLTKGIGHRGWLRFKISQVSQRDVNGGRIVIDVWLVDALQGKHKLDYKKKSDQEWDKSFYIFKDH